MYQPAQFAESRPEVLREFLRMHAFGTLVTMGPDGLNANHLPFEFDPEPAPHGTLRAHVARNNPVWRETSSDVEALVVFQGPHAYVSPGWYPSKKEDPRVVPTYNYVVVHAYGRLRAIEDKEWLRGMVARLSQRHEATMPEPWSVGDAPTAFIDNLLGAIVGIEVPVSRMIGKWKVSQNQPTVNRQGVVEGLRAQGAEQALAMAAEVARRMPR